MAQFKFEELDDVVHGRVRLGTLAYLTTAGGIEVRELKKKLDVTDGNLAIHLRKLATAGYITLDRQGAGRTSATRITLTDAGRDAFLRYLDVLVALQKEVRKTPRPR
jgi:DNA-binding MarR family transcriptional regulator